MASSASTEGKKMREREREAGIKRVREGQNDHMNKTVRDKISVKLTTNTCAPVTCFIKSGPTGSSLLHTYTYTYPHNRANHPGRMVESDYVEIIRVM